MTVDRATELNHTCLMVHSSSRRYIDMDHCYYILIASLELRWHIGAGTCGASPGSRSVGGTVAPINYLISSWRLISRERRGDRGHSVDIVDIVNKYTASIPHSHIPPDRVLIVVEQRDLAVATCSCSTVGREKLDSG